MVVKLVPPLRILPLLALAGAAGCSGSDEESDASAIPAEGTRPGECADGADNDQDGDFDCNDADCSGAPDCSEANTPGGCGDGADNDRDGRFDCDDSDCVTDDGCASADSDSDGDTDTESDTDTEPDTDTDTESDSDVDTDGGGDTGHTGRFGVEWTGSIAAGDDLYDLQLTMRWFATHSDETLCASNWRLQGSPPANLGCPECEWSFPVERLVDHGISGCRWGYSVEDFSYMNSMFLDSEWAFAYDAEIDGQLHRTALLVEYNDYWYVFASNRLRLPYQISGTSDALSFTVPFYTSGGDVYYGYY